MKQNLFENIPDKIPDEIFETLIENNNVRVEKIISKGHSSPKDFWYNQEENEWVILLKGHAKLLFEKTKCLICYRVITLIFPQIQNIVLNGQIP
jgi:cupin 2 domain-containing protein